tara:strand:- start:403 stop:735 length:333 start_codon:yes stop_codon:yes gene_type:complete
MFGIQVTQTTLGTSKVIGCPFCKIPCRVDDYAEEILGEHIKGCLAKTVWMKNSATNQCVRCSKRFTTKRRKHHCRKCKVLVCSSCCPSKQRLMINGKQERVCNVCISFTI